MSRLQRTALVEILLALRGDQPDAPPLERRTVEQDDARPRMLLGQMRLLRYVARLHRPVRRRNGCRTGGLDGHGSGPNRFPRLPFRRRSRTAEAVARPVAGTASARPPLHMVDEHPFRAGLYGRPVPTDGRRRLHCRIGRAGGSLRPAARNDKERHHHRTGHHRHAQLLRGLWYTPTSCTDSRRRRSRRR